MENNYQLLVKGNVRMLSVVDSFATEASYKLVDLGLNARKPELREYILEELDVRLTAYADPNTYQLIEYVNKLAKMLNRQHICIDVHGAVKGLLNLTEIKEKWELLKKELMLVNPIAAFEIVKQKDRELANPKELLGNLSNAHFLHLFLYCYPVVSGSDDRSFRETCVRDRMGIGFDIPVRQKFDVTTTEQGKAIRVETLLDEKRGIDRALLIQVTGQEVLQVKHFMHADFLFNKDNTLSSAQMHVFEQLNEEYTTDLYLDLKRIG